MVVTVFFATVAATRFPPDTGKCICCVEAVSRAANLATMRGSTIWFALAVAWGADCVLSLFHHNRLQAFLTALFATCFLAVGVAFRRRERSSKPFPQKK